MLSLLCGLPVLYGEPSQTQSLLAGAPHTCSDCIHAAIHFQGKQCCVVMGTHSTGIGSQQQQQLLKRTGLRLTAG